MSLRMRRQRAAEDRDRVERGSPWVVRVDASTRRIRVLPSEFSDLMRVLRCGQKPRAWHVANPEVHGDLAAYAKERNRRKRERRERR